MVLRMMRHLVLLGLCAGAASGGSVAILLSGHKTKLHVACFRETVLWRQKRTTAELNKHDVAYSEGVFLGTGGMSTELPVGAPRGVL